MQAGRHMQPLLFNHVAIYTHAAISTFEVAAAHLGTFLGKHGHRDAVPVAASCYASAEFLVVCLWQVVPWLA